MWLVSLVAKICQNGYGPSMTTMNISLPESLKDFVDEQVGSRGFGTSSEYVRALIRKDLERQRLRGLLFDGARSAPGPEADSSYFEQLRRRAESPREG
jgi:antitoxin ParD1/3/4